MEENGVPLRTGEGHRRGPQERAVLCHRRRRGHRRAGEENGVPSVRLIPWLPANAPLVCLTAGNELAHAPRQFSHRQIQDVGHLQGPRSIKKHGS